MKCPGLAKLVTSTPSVRTEDSAPIGSARSPAAISNNAAKLGRKRMVLGKNISLASTGAPFCQMRKRGHVEGCVERSAAPGAKPHILGNSLCEKPAADDVLPKQLPAR